MCMMRAGTMSQCEHDYCQWQCMSVGKKSVLHIFYDRGTFFPFQKHKTLDEEKSSPTQPWQCSFPIRTQFFGGSNLFRRRFFLLSKTFICNLSADWIGNRLYGTRLIIIIIFNYTRSSFVSDETLKSAFGEITSPFLQASPFIFRGMNLVN